MITEHFIDALICLTAFRSDETMLKPKRVINADFPPPNPETGPPLTVAGAKFLIWRVIRTVKDMRWEMESGFEPLLETVLASEAKVIKESPAKRVTAHQVGDRLFFVKRYRHKAVPLRPLKFFFKPSQALLEWRLAQRLERLEIPTVRHLALGEQWAASGLEESVLITEGFDGVPLHLASSLDLEKVVAFVTRMHERGALQRDLHPANILVCEKTGELRLVDLHGTVVKPSLSLSERAENLAYLRMGLPIPVSEDICRLSKRLGKRFLAHRSRRCWRKNAEFTRGKFGALLWQVRLPFLTKELTQLLEAPDQFLETGARLLKTGRSATVGAGGGLVLKRHNLRKPLSLVKDLFRRSRAFRAFRKAYHLELAAIPTARPVAAAEVRKFGFPVRSFFVMEEIPGARCLGEWRGDSLAAASQVARLIAMLHEAGFTHRDLKESNLVFDQTGTVHLIDLEGLKFVGTVTPGQAAADLARLGRAASALPDYSHRLGLLFLRRYCRMRQLHLRSMIRQIRENPGCA
jgi:tRNA A-37 threonylcarbamoyl transferase component Bud32